jgi:glycosyltransferase involved in cell wall biosynthesis
MPSYNHDEYIHDALESIRMDVGLLYCSSELIIIDDGSFDSSRVIIEEWCGKHMELLNIKYFFQENEGISAVLNKLIDAASGQFLRLCASDDLLVPGSTQQLFSEFERREELIAVIGDAEVIDGNGHLICNSSISFHGGRTKRLLNPQRITRELIQNWCIAGPSILIRRTHYDNMQYVPGAEIDDYKLFLSILEVPDSMSFLSQAICKYRVHGENTSKTTDVMRRIRNLNSFLVIVDEYISRGVLASYLYPVRHITQAKICYLNGCYMRAVVNALSSIFFKIKSGGLI